jgi:hypothetical protein
MADKDIEVTFLRNTEHGGAKSQPGETAALLAQFIAGAKLSLDVAIYDFKLSGTLSTTTADAFKQAAKAGVAIRIGYDADKPEAQTTTAFEETGGDPAPIGTEVWLKEQFDGVDGIEFKRIVAPGRNLMHSRRMDGLGQLHRRCVDAPGEQHRASYLAHTGEGLREGLRRNVAAGQDQRRRQRRRRRNARRWRRCGLGVLPGRRQSNRQTSRVGRGDSRLRRSWRQPARSCASPRW